MKAYKVVNTHPRNIHVGGFWFGPEATPISAEEYQRLMANRQFKKCVDEGVFYVTSADGKKLLSENAPEIEVKSIGDLKVPEVDGYIKDILNPGILRDLIAEEESGKNRRGVIAKIQDRLDFLLEQGNHEPTEDEKANASDLAPKME